MSSGGYDEMGPRIDLGPAQDEPETGPATGTITGAPGGTATGPATGTITPPPTRPKAAIKPPVAPVKRRRSSGGGSSMVALISLLVAMIAVGVSVYAMVDQPEAAPEPTQTPEVMPGGALKRLDKLEKDAFEMMLRLGTLEKELRAVSSKAGSITKLTEMSAKISALQSRLDTLRVKSKLASSRPAASNGATEQAKPAATQTATAVKPKPAEAKPAAKPKPKTDGKKMTYTVRSGDSLFDIALRYKVSVRNLKKWNKMRSNKIRSGQKLTIYK
jgi:LysM repeat protein